MKQSIAHIALVVKDYDEAIEFYTQKLKFQLIEDTYQPAQNKRWIVMAPPGSTPGLVYSLLKPLNQIRKHLLATRQVEESFYF